MTTAVTIETIEAKHAEITKMIEELKAPKPTTYGIPEALIELAPGEQYAGLVLDQDGEPLHHLILLPDLTSDLSWEKARSWAEEVGGELPTRQEQSLLFANLKKHFEPQAYWSCEQHEEEPGWAWSQHFGYGGQTCHRESYGLRARAVRRLVIE